MSQDASDAEDILSEFQKRQKPEGKKSEDSCCSTAPEAHHEESCGCESEPNVAMQEHAGQSCCSTAPEAQHKESRESEPNVAMQEHAGQSCCSTAPEAQHKESRESEPNVAMQEHAGQSCCSTAPEAGNKESCESGQGATVQEEEKKPKIHEHNVIFVGEKSIMTYVTATLTQLATQPVVTVKARGRKITQAADVSQMIAKRMGTVGYGVKGVRISSDDLVSPDGKNRKVSTIEIDLAKK